MPAASDGGAVIVHFTLTTDKADATAGIYEHSALSSTVRKFPTYDDYAYRVRMLEMLKVPAVHWQDDLKQPEPGGLGGWGVLIS